jgi:predicted RNA-binding protein with PUA-like domain
VPGIAGIARVAGQAYPDPTQFKRSSHYFDPKSTAEAPRWWMVDVEYVRTLDRVITLAELKERPELEGMPLLARGSRLSVQPVAAAFWRAILKLEKST